MEKLLPLCILHQEPPLTTQYGLLFSSPSSGQSQVVIPMDDSNVVVVAKVTLERMQTAHAKVTEADIQALVQTISTTFGEKPPLHISNLIKIFRSSLGCPVTLIHPPTLTGASPPLLTPRRLGSTAARSSPSSRRLATSKGVRAQPPTALVVPKPFKPSPLSTPITQTDEISISHVARLSVGGALFAVTTVYGICVLTGLVAGPSNRILRLFFNVTGPGNALTMALFSAARPLRERVVQIVTRDAIFSRSSSVDYLVLTLAIGTIFLWGYMFFSVMQERCRLNSPSGSKKSD